ncbi:hypothetical protein CH54_1531 [Yersinia rochesterensis]|uniref:Uncharacterized protein n=1 Tax=Yersinia rochesterensis TaxID=1604335 RepID=A0ABM5SJZ7_9GAMM|nr:hypothetical protein [Yersinia rochesterensis]AJI87650.1 hypothetical protein AW19_132 [Yersinia frederiksenii Y225]AJJ34810.1 hypothetical protein CH54_1531 [Yersinia rochesterensis]
MKQPFIATGYSRTADIRAAVIVACFVLLRSPSIGIKATAAGGLTWCLCRVLRHLAEQDRLQPRHYSR